MISTRNFIQFLLLSSVAVVANLTATTKSHSSQQNVRKTYGCTGTQTQGTGEVLIRARGNPFALDLDDIAALEFSYMQTLQQMEPSPCFKVLDARIYSRFIQNRRNLMTHEHQQRRRLSSGFQFVLWFAYSCNQCSGNLFKKKKNDGHRNLLNLNLPTTTAETTKISRSAFNSAFQTNFQSNYPELQEKIPEIISLSELQVMSECSIPRYDHSTLAINFEGDHSPLENGSFTQISVLEDAIKNAYDSMNSPNPHSSDTHTRTLSEVAFSFSQDFGNRFTIYFSVWYEYRNGSTYGKIFDDLVDWGDSHRTEIMVSQSSSSLIQEECLYDVAAQYLRAPTSEEFVSALNSVLQQSDHLDFVISAKGAME